VPAHWPEGRFDLIVLSEVVYYLDRADVAALAALVRDAIVPGGDILLVHWLGETHYPLSGDEAVALFTASTGSWTHPLSATRHAAYRLDLLRATAAT
jgi:hypothetical protein